MFATRLNYQVKPFVSWKPDPECMAVDAFTVNWETLYLCVPSFQHHTESTAQVGSGQSRGLHHCSSVADSSLVSPASAIAARQTCSTSSPRRSSTACGGRQTSSSSSNAPSSLPLVRKCLEAQGVYGRTAVIIMSSWRSSTKSQYQTYLQRWESFVLNGLVIPFIQM